MLDLALEPPLVNTRPGPEYDDQVRPGNMVIGIERTNKGRLWAAWVGNGDSPNGFFMLASSDDNGQKWSRPRVVIDPTDPPNAPQRRALVGNLWTDPLGRLWCFFDQSLGYFDGRSGDWYIRCDDPDAEDPQWTAPIRFADGCTLNKPIVLSGTKGSSGEWLLPVSLWTRDRIGPAVLKEAHRELDSIRMANVFASTDQGQTWTRRGGVAFPDTDFDEHMLVERQDGSVWMLARTKNGISESFSLDRGATWSEPQPSAIKHVSSRFFIRRLTSGKLLLVKNGPIDVRLPRRSSLTAFLSSDDGLTWGKGLLLDDRSVVSYPDGIQAPDGSIYVLYDWNRHTDAEVLLTKFTEDDFAKQTKVSKTIVNKARAAKIPNSIKPDPKWAIQAAEDATRDFKSIPYDGVTPNKMVCDTTLRELPDGSWILFILAGGDTEPSPLNYTGVTRSSDQGKTWTPLERFDVGFPRSGKTIGQGPTELLIHGQRSTLFFGTHSKHWADDWRSWFLTSDDSFQTWSAPQAVPGQLKNRTFIRKHIVCKDGRIVIPFQHYIGPESQQELEPLNRDFTNPRNGVLISNDQGQSWTEHGNIRLSPDDRYFGWAENDLFEHPDGRITMIIRGDRLGGMLYTAESKDGGRTWPEFASVTSIPNPGSKATLYNLGGEAVALLHNPNSKHRSPLALWISFDGMKTWPYQRVLQAESVDGPTGRLNYPDGFLSQDKQWLHFAFDDNRHRAVHYSAKLPPLPEAK